jgi:hypothetical protein
VLERKEFRRALNVSNLLSKAQSSAIFDFYVASKRSGFLPASSRDCVSQKSLISPTSVYIHDYSRNLSIWSVIVSMLLFHLFASSEGLGFVPIGSKKILAAFHLSLKKQGWIGVQNLSCQLQHSLDSLLCMHRGSLIHDGF